jgi:hypothetical protein
METDMKNETFHKLVVLLVLFLVSSYSQIKGKCIDENGIELCVNISVKGKAIGQLVIWKVTFIKFICYRK